jgi:1-acyl-sn-glycerol-3-phosphate acyltransferase
MTITHRRQCLDRGWSVVIFPQGTRRRHKILDFKHGGVTLAQEANVPLVPVTIELPEDLYAIGCKVSGCMH